MAKNNIWERAEIMRQNGGRLDDAEDQTQQERAMNYQRLGWTPGYFELHVTCPSSFPAFAEWLQKLCE